MKLSQTFAFSLATFMLTACAYAVPVTKIFRVTDGSGNPVAGATVAVGGTTLTAGTAATATGKNIDTAAALSSPSVTYYDYNDGTGEYALIYDPATAPGHFAVTVSKSGVTISNPTFAVDFYPDPSNITVGLANTVSLLAGQSTLQTGQTSIKSDTTTLVARPAQTGDTYALSTSGAGVKIAPGQSTTATNFVAGPTLAQMQAGLPTDASITTDSYNSMNLAAPGSPVAGSLFALEVADQASSAAAAATLASLVSGGKFTANALSLAPASSGGGAVTVAGYATGQDPATLLSGSFSTMSSAISGIPAAVLLRPLSHGMTVGQTLVLLQAEAGAAGVTNTWNPTTHVLTTAYQFSSDSAPVRSDATQYPSTQVTAPPVASRTTTLGTIAQP